MTTVVDARGLSCPQPVLQAKKAIEAGRFPIEVLVDTVTSRENVRRMSEKAGLRVRVEQIGEEFKLVLEQ
jgi:tRNA 2-thiouridine synthesizing protein A